MFEERRQIDPKKCDVCGNLHVGGPFARPCHYDELRAAFGAIELSPDEDRILRWLAGVGDRFTVDAFLSMFRKLDAR